MNKQPRFAPTALALALGVAVLAAPLTSGAAVVAADRETKKQSFKKTGAFIDFKALGRKGKLTDDRLEALGKVELKSKFDKGITRRGADAKIKLSEPIPVPGAADEHEVEYEIVSLSLVSTRTIDLDALGIGKGTHRLHLRLNDAKKARAPKKRTKLDFKPRSTSKGTFDPKLKKFLDVEVGDKVGKIKKVDTTTGKGKVKAKDVKFSTASPVSIVGSFCATGTGASFCFSSLAEPSSVALGALSLVGIAGAGIVRRRRRRQLV